jgi:hypothetical protein
MELTPRVLPPVEPIETPRILNFELRVVRTKAEPGVAEPPGGQKAPDLRPRPQVPSQPFYS